MFNNGSEKNSRTNSQVPGLWKHKAAAVEKGWHVFLQMQQVRNDTSRVMKVLGGKKRRGITKVSQLHRFQPRYAERQRERRKEK